MKRSHTCTGSPTTQGPLATRDNAASDIAFRTYDRVGTLDNGVFEAQYPARVHPCQRFAAPSRVANA